ncbi:c-type cytochrome domain-containing protein [Ulvibacterium marinum]|uniref:c-type cytochrome domain-containing protein n=1 Tax=Ulvibacterium marinum TaxID=2419782 RepID=UPI002493D11C|nr:c-type cytochrome domain-containing protein [Ulvibacterium marinum]
MDVLKQLLGRLHPLVVHLPIGFIILGLLLQWYDRKRKEYTKVISLVYLWGGISAALACITGYLQYLGEGYAFDTVKWHLWSGIATALFSFLMYTKLQEIQRIYFLGKVPIAVLAVLFFALISFTGHQGGNITHGEDYLVEPLPNHIKSALGFETFEEKPIVLNEENWQEALIYDDVVKPILNNNCVSCHGKKKTKGELQLHTPEVLLKGGENGEIIITNNPENSELYTRLVLPKNDEDHMPPKDKRQPTPEEIELIKAWLSIGNPFEGAIGELGMEKELFLSFFPKKHNADYPDIQIAAASQDTINATKSHGLHVEHISKASNFLEVSCINKPSFVDSDFEIIIPLKEQIAILDLGGTQITDDIFEKLATLTNLTVLKLDATAITGKNMELLASLEHLKSINLTGSHLEEIYLRNLESFKNLEIAYVFGSQVEGEGVRRLKDGQITIDYGNYELPPLPSDSIIY